MLHLASINVGFSFSVFYEGVDTVFVHTLITMSPGDQNIFSLLVCQSLSGSCPIYFLIPVSEQKGLMNDSTVIF